MSADEWAKPDAKRPQGEVHGNKWMRCPRCGYDGDDLQLPWTYEGHNNYFECPECGLEGVNPG